MLIWDVSTAGGKLARQATTPAPIIENQILIFSFATYVSGLKIAFIFFFLNTSY